MYGHGESQDPTIAEQCANENNMDWSKISSCYQGSFGHQLELEYANETASLNPPHEYTPWVTINGKVIYTCTGSARNNSQPLKNLANQNPF